MNIHNGGQQALLPDNERIRFHPRWFSDALACAGTVKHIAFRGRRLNTLNWRPDHPAPGIVFVHGNGAHARWFDFIAPLLMPHYHMVALDLPGMGDSDWLEEYSRDIMSEAVIETIRQSGFATKPAIIAHSFGGMVTVNAMQLFPNELAAALICDYISPPLEYHTEWYEDRTIPSPPTRIYETEEEALSRFRLLPEQPCENEFIVDYIARHSIRSLDGSPTIRRDQRHETGFTWKFDNTIYDGFVIGTDLVDVWMNTRVPFAYMFGGLSHNEDFRSFQQPAIAQFVRRHRPDVPFYEVPGARHHIMLDRPHAFAASVANQMEQWRSQGLFGSL